MTYLFLGHPTCSTVAKARNWLNNHHVAYTERNIVKENPTAAELKEWIKKSGKKASDFFNTSGMKYRELDLKNKKLTLTEDEQIKLLSTDGMLVKRPLLIGENFAVAGFKQSEWEKLSLK